MSDEIDRLSSGMADELMSRLGNELMEKVRLRLLDTFARRLLKSLDTHSEDIVSSMLNECVENVKKDPMLTEMLNVCARRSVAKRTKLRLETLGVDLRTLTEDQREWLKKHGYELCQEREDRPDLAGKGRQP